MITKNDILVVIASKDRANITFTSGTMSWLSSMPEINYVMSLEKTDIAKYTKINPKLNHIVLEENNKGLGYSLTKLKEYAVANGFKYIFKIDDDIRLFASHSGKKSDAIPNFTLLMKELTYFLNKGADGVAYKYQDGLFNKNDAYSGLSPVFKTCYCIKVEYWHPRADISTFEDFYATLVFRSLGGRGLTSAKFGISTCDNGKHIGVLEGGLQLFDRKSLAAKEIEIFKKLGCGVKYKPDSAWGQEPILPKVKRCKS